MGLVQLAKLRDFWVTHETVNLPFFHRIFSRDIFLQIFWMLHAGEIRGTNRCSKIQPLIDIVIPLFRQYFDRAVVVDEAMIAYKGSVAFRQFIHLWQTSSLGHQSLCINADSPTGYLYWLSFIMAKKLSLFSHTSTTLQGQFLV